jgi:DNA helicase-2/ATP-dependent DNA helicase PcrA
VNPADDEAFLRAIAVPRRGVGASSLATLAESATTWDMSLLETAAAGDRIQGLRPNVREALTRFADLIATLTERVGDEVPARVLEEVVEAINYERLLHDEGPEGRDRWENVRELIAAAAGWSEIIVDDAESTTPLHRFLSEAALLSAPETTSGDENGVTLMTIHTAKGLEWPVVVVAGLEDGLFPLSRAVETTAGEEEERRLFYVALTRAKDKIYLAHARVRRRGGDLMPSIPSRFLESLPPGLLDERTTSSLVAPRWSGHGGRASGRWAPRAQPWPSRGAGETRQEPVPVEELSQDSPRYVKGERVRHRRFGSGTIEGLSGAGKDLKVRVAFDDEDVGTKQLLVTYAGLEREWESA